MIYLFLYNFLIKIQLKKLSLYITKMSNCDILNEGSN